MKKNFKIIMCLLLARELNIFELLLSMQKNFQMSFQQVTYFIETLIKLKLLELDEERIKYNVTRQGNDILKYNGIFDLNIEAINNQNYDVDEDFYHSYLNK